MRDQKKRMMVHSRLFKTPTKLTIVREIERQSGMEGKNISNVSMHNASFNSGTTSQEDEDPMVLATSYVMYKIGEFTVLFLERGKSYYLLRAEFNQS